MSFCLMCIGFPFRANIVFVVVQVLEKLNLGAIKDHPYGTHMHHLMNISLYAQTFKIIKVLIHRNTMWIG
jgi:hypothetical protein